MTSVTFWELDLDAGGKGRACRIANRGFSVDDWKTHLGSEPYREKTCPPAGGDATP